MMLPPAAEQPEDIQDGEHHCSLQAVQDSKLLDHYFGCTKEAALRACQCFTIEDGVHPQFWAFRMQDPKPQSIRPNTYPRLLHTSDLLEAAIVDVGALWTWRKIVSAMAAAHPGNTRPPRIESATLVH